MSRPQRLQLSRAKGFRLQEASRALNGLPAIHCARPGPWANPFPWRGSWIVWTAVALGFRADEPGRKAAAVAIFRHWLTGEAHYGPLKAKPEDPAELRYSDGTEASMQQHCEGLAAMFSSLYRDEFIRTPEPPSPETVREQLRGHNLACWCAPNQPCHADVLLELANG